MPDWFPQDLGHASAGHVLSLRAKVALDIVRHAALVVGYPDGEDHAGRAKLGLMPSAAVAARANGIAAAIVDEWELLGWIREPAITPEEDAKLQGALDVARAEASDAMRNARYNEMVAERSERIAAKHETPKEKQAE